jgi:hypothetical protein
MHRRRGKSVRGHEKGSPIGWFVLWFHFLLPPLCGLRAGSGRAGIH